MRVFAVSSLLFVCGVVGAEKEEAGVVKRKLFGHEAIDLVARQLGKLIPEPAASAKATTTTTRSQTKVLTYLTPSPSANRIPITAQFQRVTSYVPKITICALPPVVQVFGSFSNLNPTRTHPPYLNQSAIVPTGPGTCLTSYSPTVTPICHTTLYGLASKFTVSDCTQEITFSTDVNYQLHLITPSVSLMRRATPTPYVQTQNTYYVALWDELTKPGVPPSQVEQKICRTHGNGTEVCISNLQQFDVRTVTRIRTVIKTVDLATTIKGPAEVMIETWHATVTGKETHLSLSTHLAVTYNFETETTVHSNLTATRTLTKLVGYNSASSTKSQAEALQLPSDLPSRLFPIIELPVGTCVHLFHVH
jgi:hypothetical protein